MPSHHVVVVGGGFAGLQLVKKLKGAGVLVTLVDRRNHHLFQPLLYQSATSILSLAEIAWPLRQVLGSREDVEVLLGEAVGVDRAKRELLLAGGETIKFDTLVLATGVTHAYFGHDEWRQFAPGLKSGVDAARIRNRILTSFEAAERSMSQAEQQKLSTFVIVGGGPTGVELAGMIADLAQSAFPRDFRRFDTRAARILLVEAGPRLLPAFDPTLSEAARQLLLKKGVEVSLNVPVTQCNADGARIGERDVPAETIIWAAGVEASPAARWLGSRADRAGRVIVGPDLTIPGDETIFVIGDTAHVEDAGGKPIPGLAPAAKQQGQYVAAVIRARLSGQSFDKPFRYRHQGSLATIGHRAAVADFGRVKMKGYLAWWVWGVVHIFFLIGARSRIAVALSWLWTYLKGEPTARLIDEISEAEGARH